MTDLLRPVLDFIHAGGVTMIPLLLCCTLMWHLLLGVWLTLLTTPTNAACRRASATLTRLCSGNQATDRELADQLTRAVFEALRQRLSLAAVLAGVAPLLGLFGTVTGMIDTFDSVARFGTISPGPLSAGISQAMISTQTGLVVAIPGLITVYFLRRRVRRVQRGSDLSTLCRISDCGDLS